MERQPHDLRPAIPGDGASGEEAGRLEDALDRVAFQFEKLDALRRQIRSAMMYPAFIFVFALVVLIAIVAFVVPVFVGIFKEIASEQPGESATCRS